MIFYIVNFIVVLVYFIHTVEGVNVSTAIVVRNNSKQIFIAKKMFLTEKSE